MTVKCGATKRDGSPCTLPAQGAKGLCWAHNPQNREARRKGARKGGRRGASGELHALKDKLVRLGDDVLAGNVGRGDAAVASGCYGTASKVIETEIKLRELQESRLVETQLRVQEQNELIARLEAMEEAQVADKPSAGGGHPWGG